MIMEGSVAVPSLITHCQCVRDALASFHDKDTFISRAVGHHTQVAMLGAQAGDPFFYEGAVPWEKRLYLRTLGEKMHESRVNQFFRQMLLSLNEEPASSQMKLAYLLGYLAHYALDAHTHPFIFYWSGFAEDPGNQAQQYRFKCDHSAFEKAIDLLFFPAAHRTPVHQWIQPSREEEKGLSEWLAPLLYQVYDTPVSPEGVAKSVKDMQLIYRWLMDRTGWKRRVAALSEAIFKPPGYITANIYPSQIPSGSDPGNLSHKPWCLPWDHQAVQHQSFLEVYQEGVTETVFLWQGVEDWIKGRASLEELLKKMGNRSFTTGLDCDHSVIFRYQHQHKNDFDNLK